MHEVDGVITQATSKLGYVLCIFKLQFFIFHAFVHSLLHCQCVSLFSKDTYAKKEQYMFYFFIQRCRASFFKFT